MKKTIVISALVIFVIALGLFLFFRRKGMEAAQKEEGLELINAMVSKNPATKGKWNEKLPASWSENEDNRVHAVFQKILVNCRTYMEALAKNSNRSEFSTTISTSVPYSPCSVGQMCEMAIEGHFDFIGIRYKSRQVGEKSFMCDTYFGRMKSSDLSQWWFANKSKTDDDIRMIIKKWYIQHENENGFENDRDRKEILSEIESRYELSKKETNQIENGK